MDVSSSARKSFEAENNVQLVVDSIRDGIYTYDKHEQEYATPLLLAERSLSYLHGTTRVAIGLIFLCCGSWKEH